MKQEMSLEVKFLMQQAAANAKKFTSDIKGINAELQKSSAGKELKQAFTGIEQEAKKADIAFRLFGVSSSDLKNRQSQLKAAAVDLVASGIAPERKEIQSLITEYQRLGSESDTLESSQQGLFGIFDKLKSEIGSVAAITAAVAFDKAIIGAGSFAMEAADSFQTARNEWGTLLQDMEAGAAVFDSIIKPFNDKTPFELDTVDQAAKVLRAAKVEISDLTNWLTRMGDLSQGNAQKMQSFTNAFSKASAKGKADMEVLNVYIDQGVPILDSLAKQAGVSSAEIVKMASDGKISFADYASALEEMTSKGGQYYGGLELASKSYKAMQEGLNESVKTLASSFGQMLLPAATATLGLFAKIINAVNESPFVKGVFVAALVIVGVYLNAMAVKAGIAFLAQMKLNLSIGALNPVVMAATVAVAAIVGGLTIYATAQQKATTESNKLALANKSNEETANNLKQKYDDLTQSLDNYKSKLMDVSYTEVKRSSDLAKQQLALAEEALASITEKEKNIKPVAVWEGLNPDIAKLNVSEQLKSDRLKVEDEIAQLKLELKMYDEVLKNQDSNKLSLVDEIYSKTTEGKIEKLQIQLKQIKDEISEGGSDEFLKKADYAIKQINKEIEDLQKKEIPLNFTTEWTDKELTGVNALNDQRYKAYQKLRDEALKIYGDEYTTQAEYQTQLYSMNKHYDEEIAKFNKEEADKLSQKAVEEAQKERNRIKELSQKRKDAYLEEAQYRQALAAQSMESAQNPQDYFSAAGDYAAQSFKTAIADTDFGSLLSGAGDPMTMFIDATIKAAMEVESLSKVLNFASTIVDKMFSAGLAESLERAFSDQAQLLETNGTSLGQILSFVVNAFSGLLFMLKLLFPEYALFEAGLKMVGSGFEWLNNRILVPVGNGFIRAINAIITEINKLPGIDIPKIKQFSVIGELAEEIAKELEKQQTAIKESFERQKQTIDDTLRSQIDSIQSQYELGLITRAQYEASASSYMDAASTARTQIEDQMNSALEALAEAAEGASSIDELTAPKPTGSLWDQISTSIKDGFKNSFNGIKEDFLTKFTGIKDSVSAYFSGIKESAAAKFTGIKDAAAGYFNGIKDKAATYFDGIKDKAASYFSGASDKVSGFFKTNLNGVINLINGIITKINDLIKTNIPLIPKLAVGTTNIPRDMMAYVHQGEGVFPKTFMEGIRNNEIAIVGPEFTSPSQGRSGGNYFMVSIHVEGSVVTERKLIDVVYDGLAGVIGTGEKTPLPAGAY